MNTSNNPYPGIRPFHRSESNYFFGRRKIIDELYQKLLNTRFVSVVGVSGSGKSSLVKAGLLSIITSMSDEWNYAIFRPKSNPIDELKKALDTVYGSDILTEDLIEDNLEYSSKGIIDTVDQAKSNKSLLLVVDQFEEIFRYREIDYESKEKSIRFINLLILASESKDYNIHIMLTMRSDFLGDCAEFKGLPAKVNDGQFLVPRLTRGQYKESIIKPFEKQGGKFSQVLVSALLNDIEDDPDQLPILQHSLMRTWEVWNKDRKDNVITLEHYQQTGGMNHALSIHANEIYKMLLKHDLGEITEEIFKRLTDFNHDGKGIRRPSTVKELCDVSGGSQSEVFAVINSFRKEGVNMLTPLGDKELNLSDVIDISHESLMRKWDLLRDTWIVEEEMDQSNLLVIQQAVDKNKTGKKGSFLRGAELRSYWQWDKFQAFNKGDADQKAKVQYWADRYSVNMADIERYLKNCRRKQNTDYLIKLVLVPGTLTGIIVLSVFLILKDKEHTRVISENKILKNEITQSQQQREKERKEFKQELATAKTNEDSISIYEQKVFSLNERIDNFELLTKSMEDSISLLKGTLVSKDEEFNVFRKNFNNVKKEFEILNAKKNINEEEKTMSVIEQSNVADLDIPTEAMDALEKMVTSHLNKSVNRSAPLSFRKSQKEEALRILVFMKEIGYINKKNSIEARIEVLSKEISNM